MMGNRCDYWGVQGEIRGKEQQQQSGGTECADQNRKAFSAAVVSNLKTADLDPCVQIYSYYSDEV